MKRRAGALLAACLSFSFSAASPALAGDAATVPGLSAEQVVERNVAARGGLDAWHKVQSMIWTGHIESTHAPVPSLPFVMEMKRPDRTRFDIKVQGQPSTRIYDGVHGWKVRPVDGGRPEVVPYTREELSFAKDAYAIDGPLIDYQSKGVAISLDGMEQVDGREAYRLKITLPSGAQRHVWIDARTFLEIKYDREVRTPYGQVGTVVMFYRDYKPVEGLQMPFTIETAAATDEKGFSKTPDKMVIDRMVVNPALPDATFAKPRMGRGNKVVVGAGRPPSGEAPSGLSGLNRRSAAGPGLPVPRQLVPRSNGTAAPAPAPARNPR